MLPSSLHPHGFRHSCSSVCPCRMPAFWPPSWEMETTNTLHSRGKATPAFTCLRAKGTSYSEEGRGNTQATHSLELANSEAFPHGCLSSSQVGNLKTVLMAEPKQPCSENTLIHLGSTFLTLCRTLIYKSCVFHFSFIALLYF